MIKYVKGDLFTTAATVIAHGCNCSGGFGSGVAAQIAQNYPVVREEYLKKYRTEGWVLGDIQILPVSPQLRIANCATQQDYLPRGVCHVSYKAIGVVAEKLASLQQARSWSISVPKIGAGLAGGDWDKIEPLFEAAFAQGELTIYYLD